MNKKLYVISGSSGVGKGTVLKGFLKRNPNFMLSISCTTRKPRDGEVDGVNYFFLSKEEFQHCIDNDKFLEWAEFAGNRYGTKKKYINQCLADGKDIILEIDTKGALQVKKQMPDAVLIFIAPPSLEALERRLRGRHTEDEATIQKRLHEVKEELKRAESFDKTIINDDLDRAISELEAEIKNA
jgi:guanylate kinase